MSRRAINPAPGKEVGRRPGRPTREATTGRRPGRLVCRIDQAVIDRWEAVVAGLSGHPLYLRRDAALMAALVAWCEAQEAEHHGGQPFPPAGEARA